MFTSGLWPIAGGAVVLYLVVWIIGRRLGRGGIGVEPGYLVLVVGLRRHGKSLFVARLMAERHAAGIPVVANFTTSIGPRMSSWRDAILAPRGSMVVLDEVHQWAGSRSGQSLRLLARWYIAMCGKLDHEVYIIAQHESQVPGEIRDQVNEIIECRRISKKRGLHRASSYAPHEFRKKSAKPLWTWSYQVGGPAVQVYNTKDLIPPEVSRKQSHDEDMATIVECIALIEQRDSRPLPATDDELLDGWLEAAGVSV